METVLSAQGLRYQFKDGNRKQLLYPDIEVKQQDHVLVIGPSGFGKSSLLNMLAGFVVPDSGSIIVGGNDYSKMSAKDLEVFRGANLGFVFQQPVFVESLSVEDNFRLQLKAAKLPYNRRDVIEYMQAIGLQSQVIREKPGRLSVGERQRLEIARALIHHPLVVLADEPTSGLDNANAQNVFSLMKRVCAMRGAALVVVTHDDRIVDPSTPKIQLDEGDK